MKYCPSCQSTFDGDETFCPHDGTRLAATDDRQPGRLTGSSLDGVVNLESFRYSDHIGERYSGRLLSDNSPVLVTVFHRNFDRSRAEKARQLGAELPAPLPEQLLEVHSLRPEATPTFIIEEAPDADSLQRVMEKQGPLDWQQALRLTIRLARILDWLVDHGVAHRAVHPENIYLNAPDDRPRLGGWPVGVMTFPLPDFDDDTPADAIPVYPGFIAPEWLLDDPDDVDAHTAAVYTAGALLLSVLDQPPVDDDDDTDFFTWLHRDDDPTFDLSAHDAPDSLQQLVGLMVARSPDKRFDSLNAAINALSTLLDEDADEIAAPLESRDNPVFGDQRETVSIPAADDDSGDDGEHSEPRQQAETQMGLPSQAADLDDATGNTQPGHTPRVIADDPDDSAADDAIPTAGAASASDADDGGSSQKSTMLMGAVTVDDMAAEAVAEQDADADETDSDSTVEPAVDSSDEDDDLGDAPDTVDSDDDPGSTALHHPVDLDDLDDDDSDGDQDDEKDEGDAEAEKKDHDDHGDDSEDIDDESADDKPDDREESDDRQEPASVVIADDLRDDDKADVSAPDESDDDVDDDDDDVDGDDVDESQSESADVDDDAADSESTDDQTPDDRTDDSGELKVGFVEAEQSADDDLGDDVWFANSTEDAWEQDFVREKKRRSKLIEKGLEYGLIIGGVLFVIGAYIVFQSGYFLEEEPDEAQEAVAQANDEPEIDEADLQRFQDQFDQGLERQELLEPRERSALDALQNLERYADDDVYDQARQRFVEAADELSRFYEEEGNLLKARDLSGYANELEPDDEELRERALAVQDKFLAAQRDEMDDELDDEDADGDDDDDNGDDDAGDDTTNGDAASAEPPTQQATGSVADVDELLQQGRDAHDERDYQRARDKFEAVLKQAPDHPQAHFELGDLAFNDGDRPRAIDHFERALEAAPGHTSARLMLGRAHFREGDTHRAIDIWEEVLEQDPDNQQAKDYINLAERRLN